MVQPLVRGISKVGRGKTYHRRGLWAIKKKNGGKFPVRTPGDAQPRANCVPTFWWSQVHAKKAAAEPKAAKAPKFYAPEDEPKALHKHVVNKPTKLRASITPGTVVILLTGRFKGKRVVFLRQLASGLLLVTGPYSVNGVPVRRVNQAYVIATSTKVDVSGVDSSKINDHFFSKPPKDRARKSEEEFKKEQNPTARASRRPSPARRRIPLLRAVAQQIAVQLVRAHGGRLSARRCASLRGFAALGLST